MRILVGYGSRGKFFHLKEFCDELEKHNINVKLVKDTEYSRGFPSKEFPIGLMVIKNSRH